LGGPYTLEALVFGMVNGLVLVGFLAAFNVLYQALPTQALIRMIPRALYPIAVVISIAVSFVPTTLAQFQQIREAQMMRGHQIRGVRDWLPLFMPLLVGGLERAFQLAEAMTARGFGSLGSATPAAPQRLGLDPLRVTLVLGLATLLAGLLVLLFWQQQIAGWALVALGGGALLLALWRQGRRVQRTTYHRQPWTGRDGLVILAAALTVGVYVLPSSRGSLTWSPYPQISLPGVDPVIVLATLALLAPAALLVQVRRAQATFL
jgi:energy-coupling factor transport system permease protein